MVSTQPFPLMPAKSTELRLRSFDEYVYTLTTDTILYKYLDALCGTTGAGALLNQVFMARMAGAMQTIYFNELDYIFGKISFLARSPAESYTYSPGTDLLTTDQWDEIRIKDAWYRARIGKFFQACGLGGTPQGITMVVEAALACDCDIYEVWRYRDNFGILEPLGRAPITSRNEVVVQPQKSSLAPAEMRLVRDMLDRIGPLDVVYTVNTEGLAVLSPVPVNAATADSTYYEVQKVVTATPALAQLPPPELLPIDLLPSENWLYIAQTTPTLAPYAAFNITSEYGYYYLVGGGNQSPIDSVTYGTINPNTISPITVFEMVGTLDLSGQITPIPSAPFFSSKLGNGFSWVPVTFPADTYALESAINQGTVNLINAINNCTGPFVLVGYAQGAIVISNVYDELRGGSLFSRRNDLQAGLAYANPRRGAGDIFPGATDPGGHGILGNDLLAPTDAFWWEFAAPGDLATVVGEDPAGLNDQTIMELLYSTYTGSLSTLNALIDPVIDGSEAIIQTLLDLFYGTGAPTNPHHLYSNPAYQPLSVTGDGRDCIQIGADYINSLTSPSLAAPISATDTQLVCYEVGDASVSEPTFFSTNLNPAITYMWVPYPTADELPLQTAINSGITTLTAMINANPGPFVLIGTGEGAIITSAIYDAVRSGALQHRLADFTAGVAFGNPRRQAGVIFSGGTDPGGHGISATRLASTNPSVWWEFANPNDILATTASDTNGLASSELFDATLTDYLGDAGAITAQFPSTGANVALLEQNIINVLFSLSTGLTPHTNYANTTPLGDGRSSYQIAADFLNGFVSVTSAYVAPPVDPMTLFQPAANYTIFDQTGQYTAPLPYAKADSPDNYPGGQYGMHPQVAPALNTDGTPYTFPWPSQQAFITAFANQVTAQGGITGPDTYQLPISTTSSTAQVFYPNYAIAYYPPAKDSTVSTSVTRRRSSQTLTDVGNPVNFVRNT